MITSKDGFRDILVFIILFILMIWVSGCKIKEIPITQVYQFRIEWRESGKVREVDYVNDFMMIDNGCILYNNIVGQRVIRCGNFEIIKLK